MSPDRWASVHLVLRMAMVAADDAPAILPASTTIADRAKTTLVRMSRNLDSDAYDAFALLADALGQLEREVRLLRHQQRLSVLGVEFRNDLVQIAPDHIQLQRTVPFGEGQRVQLHLDIEVWGAQRLMVVEAEVEPLFEDGQSAGTRLSFVDLPGEHRDTLVALVFQEQGRQRRTQRDSESGHPAPPSAPVSIVESR